MFDLLIKNGKIVDGTGNPWFFGDVAIKEGKIQSIGFVESSLAQEIINASGLIVAPGFVDIHSHSDFVIPADEHPKILEPFVHQGITTIVIGNCGYSPAPVNPETIELLKTYTSFLQAAELQWEWLHMEGYMDFIEKKGVAYNVVPLVSHGAIRIYVKGFEGGPATDAEKREMARLAREAMEQGVFGLSSGLIYPPGVYSDTDELIVVCRPLKDFGGIFTSHVRGEGRTLVGATEEIIKVGEGAGVGVQHSHLSAFGEEHWPKLDDVLRLHDEARGRGVDITFDVLPYVAANSTLLALFPSWSIEGGVDKFIERVSDREVKRRINIKVTGWEKTIIISTGSTNNKHLEGKTLVEIAGGTGKTPFNAAVDLIVEGRGNVMALYFGLSGDLIGDKWLQKIVSHPRASINTDAIITGRGCPHPAAYGAFPKVLGYFCRDLGLFTVEEAVRRMTSMSLQRFGIRDRGLIREGCFADITIFDQASVGERSTYFEPARFPEGIKHVIINGTPVLQNGVYNGKLCGRVLRKKGRRV